VWQWRDEEKLFHRGDELSPREFARSYIGLQLDQYVCLVHDPRPSSPFGQTFTVDLLGNVVGAPPVIYLNADIGVLKEIAAGTVREGEPVWFGCDVGKMMSNEHGIWDAQLYNYELVYDINLDFDKADRLMYHQTSMTHAMLFTGVDILDDSPRRWRVENSWGESKGVNGFYTMNDSWFDEHVFEVAVRRDRLPDDLQRALSQPPVRLPAWDPMGALAH
jgi:bleomycin hydrolase